MRSLVAFVALAASAAPPQPAVLEVGPGRTFADPQAALAAALPGDRVLLHPGTYGPLLVNADVEIVGVVPDQVVFLAEGTGPAVDVAPLANPILRGLVLDGGGVERALRIGVGASVVVEDATLRNGHSAAWGGCVHLDAATLTLRRTTVASCIAEAGGGVYALDSALVLDAVTIRDNVATMGFGGGVGVQGSSVVGRGCRFERNRVDDPIGSPHFYGLGGGLFTGSGATLDLAGCVFTGNEARSVGTDAGRGGAIRLWETDATLTGTRFEGNAADEYGSAVAAASSTLLLREALAVSNRVDETDPEPAHGGTVFCDAPSSCSVQRSWFEGNTSGDGGGVCALGPLVVTTSMFCSNVAADDGGAIDVGDQDGTQPVWIAGNVFARNTAGGAGGALVVTGGPILVHNNHVVGNQAGTGAAIASGTSAATGLELSGNLVAANTAGAGPVLDLGATSVTEGHNWLHDNAPEDTNFPLGSGTGAGDPGLVGPAASCDAADLALAPGSPLWDAGDPLGPLDADGTRNDIGGFGGTTGDLAAFLDADGDGWPAMHDCDDADPNVHPDAPERCNGVDDDCDGLVDDEDDAVDAAWLFEDVDGDGVGGATHPAWRCEGPGWSATSDDCDDADPTVGAPASWYADRDGDGLGDDATVVTACLPPPGWVGVGGDCDDSDPSVGADCPDADGDGVADRVDPAPNDAGGERRHPPEARLGWGCGHRGGASGGWIGLGFAALYRRRRR